MPANSVQHQFSLVPEVTYGITPTVTPAFQQKKITGTTLGLTRGKIESETINPNRQVDDVRSGNRQVGGDITCELAYGGHDDFLQAVMCGTWTGNVLVPGVTRRSFSVMRLFTDIAAGAGKNPFHLYKGVEFNTFGLTIAPEQIVKATFGMTGKGLTYLDAAPAGATFPAAPNVKGFDSYSGAISIDGVDVAIVTEATLQIENGIEPRWVVFNDETLQPKIGKTRVTGQLTMYFETSELLVAFNGTVRKELQFSLVDLLGNTYEFLFPSCQFEGGQPDVSGENDITLALPFSTIFEEGEDVPDVLQITRIPV